MGYGIPKKDEKKSYSPWSHKTSAPGGKDITKSYSPWSHKTSVPGGKDITKDYSPWSHKTSVPGGGSTDKSYRTKSVYPQSTDKAPLQITPGLTERGKEWWQDQTYRGGRPNLSNQRVYEGYFQAGIPYLPGSEPYEMGFQESVGGDLPKGFGPYYGENVPQGGVVVYDEEGTPRTRIYDAPYSGGHNDARIRELMEMGNFYINPGDVFKPEMKDWLDYLRDMGAYNYGSKKHQAPPGIYSPTASQELQTKRRGEDMLLTTTQLIQNTDANDRREKLQSLVSYGVITPQEAEEIESQAGLYQSRVNEAMWVRNEARSDSELVRRADELNLDITDIPYDELNLMKKYPDYVPRLQPPVPAYRTEALGPEEPYYTLSGDRIPAKLGKDEMTYGITGERVPSGYITGGVPEVNYGELSSGEYTNPENIPLPDVVPVIGPTGTRYFTQSSASKPFERPTGEGAYDSPESRTGEGWGITPSKPEPQEEGNEWWDYDTFVRGLGASPNELHYLQEQYPYLHKWWDQTENVKGNLSEADFGRWVEGLFESGEFDWKTRYYQESPYWRGQTTSPSYRTFAPPTRTLNPY